MNLIKHTLKISTISIASIFVLSACGGGGGDGGGPAPIIPSQPPSVTLSGYADGASVNTLSSIDSLLQLSYVGLQSLFYEYDLRLGGEKSCNNGGLYINTLQDNDGNQQLSNGDQLTTVFRECYLDSLQGVADGQIVHSVESFDSALGYTVITNANDLMVDNTVNLSGDMRISYALDDAQNQNKLTLTTVNNVEVNVDNELVLTLSELSIVKDESYQDAKYSITANGLIKDEGFGASYRFSQTTPLSGYFNEYPNEGELKVAVSTSDSLSIEANFVENSFLFDVAYNTEMFSLTWDSVIDGAIMALNGQVTTNIYEYRSDNFRYLSDINQATYDNFELRGSVKLMFSRAIQSAQPQFGDVVFERTEWPYDEIQGTINVQGALITVTPNESFEAGVSYRLPSLMVTSINEQTLTFYPQQLTTRDDIIPMIESQSPLYRFNDTPWLSALESVNNTQGELSYEWTEVTNVGVVFDAPNAAQTRFSVPASATEAITIELIVSNEVGYSAAVETSLTYVAPGSSTLSYDSPTGDYIGGGQKRVFTTQDGSLTANYDASNPAYIEVNYNGEQWWTLQLAAPAGDSLAVGVYLDATRYPFQSPTRPGIDFSGDGRGCNQISGMFEILELVISEEGEVENFAVDFEQSCEQTMPILKGQARINSQILINP